MSMSWGIAWIFDLIVVVMLLWSIYSGYKQGFAKMVLKFVTFAAAVGIAWAFCGYIGDFLKDTDIVKNVSVSFVENISGAAIENSSGGQILEMFGAGESAKAFGAAAIANDIAQGISNVIGFIILYVVARIVLGIVAKFVAKIFEIPVLKQINKIGGIALGGVIGWIKCCILIFVIGLVIVYIPANDVFNAGSLEDTFICSILMEYNPITLFLS